MSLTVNVLKFWTPKCLTKWHMQTVQTLKEQSDQGLHCLPFHYFKKQLHNKQNLGQNNMELEQVDGTPSHIPVPAPSHISLHIKIPNVFLQSSFIGITCDSFKVLAKKA